LESHALVWTYVTHLCYFLFPPQECIGLLSQAEHLLASAQSLKSKLHHGILLARRRQAKDKAAAETDESREVCVCTEMMLEGPELVIRDPMNSVVGVAMKGLLESQGTYQACAFCMSISYEDCEEMIWIGLSEDILVKKYVILDELISMIG